MTEVGFVAEAGDERGVFSDVYQLAAMARITHIGACT